MEQLNKNNSQIEQVTPPNQIVDLSPDVIRQKTSQEGAARPIVPGFQNTGAGTSPVGTFSSLNFTNNSQGWSLGSGGDVQFNGNHVVTTHFTPVAKFLALTLYVSDGTSPNGTLSGATGDICLGGDLGKLYVCAGTTTWYAPA